MSYKIVVPLFTSILLVTFIPMSKAQTNQGAFQARLEANTTRVSAADHDFGYAFCARRLFNLVAAGKTLGLPDVDLAIIKNAGRPNGGRDAIRPYIDEIGKRLSQTNSTIELAGLLEKARRAEQELDTRFYRRVIGQLSNEGKAIFLREHADQMTNAMITEVDFVSLAMEKPGEVHNMLTGAVTNFNAQPTSSASSENSTGLGISSNKEKRDDQ